MGTCHSVSLEGTGFEPVPGLNVPGGELHVQWGKSRPITGQDMRELQKKFELTERKFKFHFHAKSDSERETLAKYYGLTPPSKQRTENLKTVLDIDHLTEKYGPLKSEPKLCADGNINVAFDADYNEEDAEYIANHMKRNLLKNIRGVPDIEKVVEKMRKERRYEAAAFRKVKEKELDMTAKKLTKEKEHKAELIHNSNTTIESIKKERDMLVFALEESDKILEMLPLANFIEWEKLEGYSEAKCLIENLRNETLSIKNGTHVEEMNKELKDISELQTDASNLSISIPQSYQYDCVQEAFKGVLKDVDNVDEISHKLTSHVVQVVASVEKEVSSSLMCAENISSNMLAYESARDHSSLLKVMDLLGGLSCCVIKAKNIIHDGSIVALEKYNIPIDESSHPRLIALVRSICAYCLQEEMDKPGALTKVITSLGENLLKFKEIGKVELEKLAIALQEGVMALDNHVKTFECLHRSASAVEHEKMSLSRVDDNTSVSDLLSDESELNSVRTEKGSILAWIGYGLCAIVGIPAATIIIGLAVATAAGAAIYCAVTIVRSVSALVDRLTQVNVTGPGFSFNINSDPIDK